MKLNPKMYLTKDIHKTEKIPTRNGYGEGLVKAGTKDKNVFALCCDLTDSTRVGWFKKKFPSRYVEVGIQEQNMAGIASGMSAMGKIPFISSYAVFSPGRNWDQLRVSVCYSKENVKIQGAHAGISVGPDGATHQALEDIAITRCLPNLQVIVPCDSIESEKATLAAARTKGPIYLRFGREKVPVITTKRTPFKFGKAGIFKEGKDVCIIACGIMVYEALIAAEKLQEQGISAMVINNHSIKPIDVQTIVKAARKCGCVVTAEEHQIQGGLGSAVSEVLGQYRPTVIEMVGVKDTFGESGSLNDLMKKYGLTSSEIIKAAKKVIKRKRKK